MVTAADGADHVRPFAQALFDSERRRRGSKMSAYAAVGDLAGMSESWVRRLLGRRPVVVEVHHALNLAAAYRRLCERIEAERDMERARTLALREVADAVVDGHLGMVGRATCADRRGAPA